MFASPSVRPGRVFAALSLGLLAAARPAAADAPRPIGAVQGSVPDGEWASVSPLLGQEATVQGVVSARLVRRSEDGRPFHSFVLQSTRGTADADPRTADGILVLAGGSPGIAGPTGEVEPAVGDEWVVAGRVAEERGQTALVQPRLVRAVRRGVALDRECPAVEAAPPDDARAAAVYWERLEGMRVRLPAGALVQGRRTDDWWRQHGRLVAIRGDHPVARRTAPYARRVFRDAHPLDDVAGERFDNGNGYRVTLGDHALGAPAAAAGLPAARTFDATLDEAVGPVVQEDDAYLVEVAVAPRLRRGPDPSANAPAPLAPGPGDLAVATFNIENLYDFRDDPFDPNDFAMANTNGGRRLYNYVPHTEAEYQDRLRGLAGQIARDLGAPDLVLVQEAEDQDILDLRAPAEAGGWVNNANGLPDVLEDLAAAIVAAGGPPYAPAADRATADERGILTAFLYRADRLRLAVPPADHPVLGAGAPRIDGRPALAYRPGPANPRALNDGTETAGRIGAKRAPLVGCFERLPPAGGAGTAAARLYAINNHFRSRPNANVEERRSQARFVAGLVRRLLADEPKAAIVVGGDLNIYPRPDDPFANPPSDQLADLYAAGLFNVYERLLADRPEAAYGYVYQGEAGTLDQLFVSPSLRPRLRHARAAHLNADFTNEPSAPDRAWSDHDPLVILLGP